MHVLIYEDACAMKWNDNLKWDRKVYETHGNDGDFLVVNGNAMCLHVN